MKKTAWPEVLEALPDTAFFEIVRNYLGPVATPFHKPDLTEQLRLFFSRDDVLKRVLEFLNPLDCRVLTTIAVVDESDEQTITRMLPELSYVVLREEFLNLEERLLIWSRAGDKGRRYELTPLGRHALESGYLGPGSIIGEGVPFQSQPRLGWFDDRFLSIALSLLTENQPVFLKEGGFRKRILEQLAGSFPTLFHDGRGEQRLLIAGRGLMSAGLVERRDEMLIPKLKAWKALETMDDTVRHAYMRARAAAGRTMPAETAMAATSLLCDRLPPGRIYDGRKLASLFQLAAGSDSGLSPLGARRIVSHLELLGELVSDGESRFGRPDRIQTDTGTPYMHMTSVGDITMKPGTPLNCRIALCAEPVVMDIATSYKVNKERFLNGLDYGVSAEDFIQALETLSGEKIPANLRVNLNEWEKEYRTLRVQLGVVLRTEGTRRQIIETTGVLEPFILDNLGSGTWVLDPLEEEAWRTAMQEVGIDRIPPLKINLPPAGSISASSASAGYRNTVYPDKVNPTSLDSLSWTPPPENNPESTFNELKKTIAAASLSQEANDAMEERLERRLILMPEQIRKGAYRFEVMSAKGLDYRGKLRLVEAALQGRDERLAVTIAVGNSVETVLVYPERVEKEGDDHVIVGITLPDEEPVRYKVRKIGFLKRMKTSLF